MNLTLKALVFALVAIVLIPLAHADDIKLNKMGDMYTVPIRINEALTMSFLLDTGAADVGFTDDVVAKLIRDGILQESDLKGKTTFTMVDGSKIECRKLILRKVHIGNRMVENVEASTCPGKDFLVAGQSLLKKLELMTIDYGREALVVKGGEAVAETATYTKQDIAYYEKPESKDDPVALLNLGVAYYTGSGVPRDMKKAVVVFQRSADAGYAPAQTDLGLMYVRGEGVSQDYAKALELFLKAAEQGNANAQYNLGVMYTKGHGVPQDYAKAVEWYRKSAEQGNAVGQSALGEMYRIGKGVPQDYAKAVEWYRKSAEQGEASGQSQLGSMYGKGEGVSQDYAKALELFKKAADQGNARGQDGLGVMYLTGGGVPQDFAKAMEWFRKSAEQGDDGGQFFLGLMYENGYGVSKDVKKAIQWYKKAAAQGKPEAIQNLQRLQMK